MDKTTLEALEAFAVRVERAADLGDRRARDADRISRWTVGIAFALSGAILSAVIALVYQVAALAGQVQALASLP